MWCGMLKPIRFTYMVHNTGTKWTQPANGLQDGLDYDVGLFPMEMY